MNAHNETIKKTVEAMIGEIGKLRLLVAIDNMPEELQQVRIMLKKLDYELNAVKND